MILSIFSKSNSRTVKTMNTKDCVRYFAPLSKDNMPYLLAEVRVSASRPPVLGSNLSPVSVPAFGPYCRNDLFKAL